MGLSKHEQEMLETFLQYGDLANAELVFVGMEEGLGGNNACIEVLARKELFTNPIFNANRIFINGRNFYDGWYINDSTCLIKAQALAKGNSITNLNLAANYSKFQAMQNQARMHWLLQGTNRTNNYVSYNHDFFKSYNNLNKPGSKSAMIDILPFPNQGNLAKEYQNIFSNRKGYEAYYKSPNSPRMRIIKYLYDHFPLPRSICYYGYEKGVFGLQKFFQTQLGFRFGAIKDTQKDVNPAFPKIKPTQNAKLQPRYFIIGERTKQDNSIQKVVLTPFWGNGHIYRNDIDVFSSWL